MLSKMYRRFDNFYCRQKQILSNFKKGIPVNSPQFISMTLDEDDIQIAKKWLKTSTANWFEADVIKQYHQTFAKWNGSISAFSFMSGREALSACIFALGLKPGDAVIIPAYTCIVVPNAFYFAGIQIIFCDIELETYGIDITKLPSKITSNTKAILLQHLYGLVCRDYDEIITFARQHKILTIEDCAHSTGAMYKGIKVGNYGDIAFYSSECSKVFNTIQGGLAVSNESVYIKKLEHYYHSLPFADLMWVQNQLHNIPFHYYTYKHPYSFFYSNWAEWKHGNNVLISTTRMEESGIKPSYYGRKMAAPLADLGLNQLAKIDLYNQKRLVQAKDWSDWCKNHGYTPPTIIPDSSPVFLRYPVLVEPHKKENLDWALKEIGLVPGVWFTSHTHPVKVPPMGVCTNAVVAVNQCINLPTLIQ